MAMKDWLQRGLRTFLSVVMLLAALGSLICLLINLLSLGNVSMPKNVFVDTFAYVLFFVWIVAIFVSNRMVRFAKRMDFWKVALSGCPVWMRRTLWTVCGYAYVVFAFFLFKTRGHGGDDVYPNLALAGLLGVVSTFYATAFAVLYSALHSPQFFVDRKCPRGHRVSPTDGFCPICGTAIASGASV
jgi:hypothetical protein